MNKETECVEIHILFFFFGIEFGGLLQMIKKLNNCCLYIF